MQRIVVVLPEPFGPRKPVTRPGSMRDGELVDGDAGAVRLRQPVELDHARQHGEPLRRRAEEARPACRPASAAAPFLASTRD